jgi:ion channel-forming bestrophin family protein
VVFPRAQRWRGSQRKPLDGGANDVPVSRICQDIQIDLREMLGEVDVPAPSRRVSDIAL